MNCDNELLDVLIGERCRGDVLPGVSSPGELDGRSSDGDGFLGGVVTVHVETVLNGDKVEFSDTSPECTTETGGERSAGGSSCGVEESTPTAAAGSTPLPEDAAASAPEPALSSVRISSSSDDGFVVVAVATCTGV